MATTKSRLTRGHIFILKKYVRFKIFLQNINYILVFFVGLLIFSFLSLVLFRHGRQGYTHDVELPKLEMFNFSLNRFNSQHVDMFIKADKGMQYMDKEVYINFFGSRLNDDLSTETLKGEEVWHKDDKYDFIKGVYYTKSPNVKFFSERGIYDTKSDIFRGSGKFFIEDTDMTTNGYDIFYNKTTDTITAKNIATQLIKIKDAK